MEIKYRDREVVSAPLRLLIVVTTTLAAILGIVLCLLALPLHVAIYAVNGRGFVKDGVYTVPWPVSAAIITLILWAIF